MHTRRCIRIVAIVVTTLVPFMYGFAQTPGYTLGTGDQILITVWGFPEFTTSATVREDGAVSIPLVGDIPAAGQEKEEFTGNLRRRLAEYIQGEIRITVSILASGSRRITVMGAVQRPDTYPFSSGTPLLTVLSAAGGYRDDADISGIRIFRKEGSEQAVTVDLEAAMERAAVDRLPMVFPGDVVQVPLQRNVLKDVGEYLGYVVVFFALVTIIEGS
jgi:polysaccharide export outer membrane protein